MRQLNFLFITVTLTSLNQRHVRALRLRCTIRTVHSDIFFPLSTAGGRIECIMSIIVNMQCRFVHWSTSNIVCESTQCCHLANSNEFVQYLAMRHTLSSHSQRWPSLIVVQHILMKNMMFGCGASYGRQETHQ